MGITSFRPAMTALVDRALATKTGTKVAATVAATTVVGASLLIPLAAQGGADSGSHGVPPPAPTSSSQSASTSHGATPTPTKTVTPKPAPTKTVTPKPTPTKTTPPPPPPIANTFTDVGVAPDIRDLAPGVKVVNYPGVGTITLVDLTVPGNRILDSAFEDRKTTAAGYAENHPDGTVMVQNTVMFDLPGYSPWPNQDPSGNGWSVVEGTPMSNGVAWPAQFTTDSGGRPQVIVGEHGARVEVGGKPKAGDTEVLPGHNLIYDGGSYLGPFAPAQDGAVINTTHGHSIVTVSQDGSQMAFGAVTGRNASDASQITIDGVHALGGDPVDKAVSFDGGGSTNQWDAAFGTTQGEGRKLSNVVAVVHTDTPGTLQWTEPAVSNPHRNIPE